MDIPSTIRVASDLTEFGGINSGAAGAATCNASDLASLSLLAFTPASASASASASFL